MDFAAFARMPAGEFRHGERCSIDVDSGAENL
jgi:hypothetical protein